MKGVVERDEGVLRGCVGMRGQGCRLGWHSLGHKT